MKKLLLTLGMFLAAITMPGMTVQAESVAVNKVIEVPGASNQQVVEKVQTWSGQYGRVNDADSKTGIVVASGEITYPQPSIDRIQYTIVYDMKNKIEGNKDTVTFENVMLKSPTQYLEDGPPLAGKTYPVTSKKDIEAVNKRLSYIADNLDEYLLAKSDAACPLVKCPECPVLSPSAEEMKEHMKVHPGHETAPMK